MQREHEGLTLDAVFRTLANRTRRRVLLDLLDLGPRPEVSVQELTYEDDSGVVVSEEVLFNVDLPYMQDLGVVSWDQDAGTVRRGPRFEEIRPAVELFDDEEGELPDDWTRTVASLT